MFTQFFSCFFFPRIFFIVKKTSEKKFAEEVEQEQEDRDKHGLQEKVFSSHLKVIFRKKM